MSSIQIAYISRKKKFSISQAQQILQASLAPGTPVSVAKKWADKLLRVLGTGWADSQESDAFPAEQFTERYRVRGHKDPQKHGRFLLCRGSTQSGRPPDMSTQTSNL